MGEFLMPALGADMSAGTLIEWQKQPGDSVERGDIIAVVHTDKADVEVETFTTGVLEELLVEPGTKVPVGTPLALIREDDAAAPAAPARPVPAPAPAAPGRLLISPSARHLAQELGIDPATVRGTGPGGRIQRKDIEAAARPPTPVPAPARAAPVPPAALPAEERGAAMRRAIAAAMARSKREIPHFYLGSTVDMSNAVRWLAEENLRRDVPDRLLHGVLFIKAVALALRQVPELNATWRDEQVVPGDGVHVGVAVSLRGGGLVAPAIHNTDALTLDELMRALRDLTGRARAGSLRSSELSDPTITVTSIGERGVESMYGVIFPPQVAIVGFGKVVERPWISEGQILPCPVVAATVSADHRVTDGHRAGLFLAAVDRLLQEPEEL
ncbi:MAG TPA: dihydrolipoamide acetyltransferase family protein [Gaiellaceae bacterium]|nr:dihydrolipoamide acetyltransferase family protein [Gaiellaceae bacterium]